jgi:hypothetical protein
MLRAAFAILIAAVIWLVATARADASPSIRYGIQDDAWLLGGPGTYEERLSKVEGLGADIVRVNLRWNEIAARRPSKPSSHLDSAYRWKSADVLLDGLHAHGIVPVVTLVGTPRWANGNRASRWAPSSSSAFANFAHAAATRYPFVRHWVIWNEPNKSWSLRPTRASTYVRLLLNPAYDALKSVNRANLVGGGVTAPRGGPGSVAPIAWLRAMGTAHARLDAYAHHPYPLNGSETPFSRGCTNCSTLTMASLDRLLSEVQRAFGRKRIWLTEYGYQTSPADPWLGVPQALQARYQADASLRAWLTPRVDMLIHFLVRDEEQVGRWQSGLFTFHDVPKLSAASFRLPLAQLSRHTLWGQVRPGEGRRPYRLRYASGGGWRWLGGTRTTGPGGIFRVNVALPRGTAVQLWSEGTAGVPLRIR